MCVCKQMYRLVCTCGETFEGSTLTPNDVVMDESILEIILEGSLWVLPSIQPKHSPRKTSNFFFFLGISGFDQNRQAHYACQISSHLIFN